MAGSTHRPSIGITGGSGFIGSSLVKRLAPSFNVKILDIAPPKEELRGSVTFKTCDIRNLEEVRKFLEDVDLVIHAAIVQIPAINERKRLGYEANLLGTQNVCKAVDENPKIKGMILASSWHTIGEVGLKGTIDESFGYRPDKVEDRAKLYVLSKIAQECIVKFYDEISGKIFGIIRMGTVLGEGMPKKTAANVFIENGLRGGAITPYKHSMHRFMLYVAIEDVCKAFESYSKKILNDEISQKGSVSAHTVNVYYQDPITIIELAEIVRDAILKYSEGKIRPKIKIIDMGQSSPFSNKDKELVEVDVNKALIFLGWEKFKDPREAIEEIVKARLMRQMRKKSRMR